MSRPRFVAVLLLAVITLLSVLALGRSGTASPHRASQQQRSHLAWLRDAVLERVYGPPSSQIRSTYEGLTSPVKSTKAHPLPGTLRAQYGDDVVLRFNLSSSEEESALAEAADMLFLDVWEFTNHWADIRLREADVPSLLGLLPDSMQKSFSNLMPDLARSIYRSYPPNALDDLSVLPNRREPAFTPRVRINEPQVENIFFREYQPLSVIVPWMRLMSSMFSTHVRKISIGTSFEGRDIPALKVGSASRSAQRNKARKTILVTGGTHAREWISTSTVLYVAWSFITSFGRETGMSSMLEEFDFVFVPTINVDGYVYTWEHDRLWRKNRQTTNLRFCRGFDLDRTYGFQWDGKSFESNPCSESYPGTQPFEAVESHMLASWAKNQTDNGSMRLVGFLDLHSYSQQVLYPYSYSCTEEPPSLENLEELALGMIKAIRLASGEQYTVSSACEGAVPFRLATKSSRMEAAGGSALDWFYHEMNVRYSYQLKLRDTGSYGFLLPKENIVPTGQEAFTAIRYFGEFLLGNKGIEVAETRDVDEDMSAAVTINKNDDSDAAVTEATLSDDEREYHVDWELRRRLRS